MRGDVMRCPLPSGELEPMAQSRLRSAAILGERFCAAVEILQKGPNFEQDFEPLAHTDIPPNQSPQSPHHPLSSHQLRYATTASTTASTTTISTTHPQLASFI